MKRCQDETLQWLTRADMRRNSDLLFFDETMHQKTLLLIMKTARLALQPIKDHTVLMQQFLGQQ